MPLDLPKLRTLTHRRQSALCKTIGMARPNLCRLLAGKSTCSLARAEQLARALDVPLMEILK